MCSLTAQILPPPSSFLIKMSDTNTTNNLKDCDSNLICIKPKPNTNTKKYTNTKEFGAFMKKKVLPEGPWKPFTDWQPGLVCVFCKTTIRKAIHPYTVNCCNAVYCANCIYKYQKCQPPNY